MSDYEPACYLLLHKYEEYSDQHIQLYVPPKNYKSEALCPNVMENLSRDALTTSSTPQRLPKVETHVLSQLH